MIKYSLLILTIVLCFSCKNIENQSNQKNKQPQNSFLDVQNIDTTIPPGDNFFKYINQKWYDKTEIPGTEIGVGSFFDLNNKSLEDLYSISKTAAAIPNAPKGSPEQMVGDLLTSIMDTNAIESKGWTPLKATFDQIDNLKSSKEMLQFICDQNIDGNDLLIGFGVGEDEKNASMNIAQFGQAGIGLPERDYYFRSDPETKSIQDAYKNYLKKIFSLIGVDSVQASRDANTVFTLETNIARGHFTNVQLRDPARNYNKMGLSQLNKMSPGLEWSKILKGLKLNTDSVVIGQPSFFASLDKLLKSTPIDQWKPYLKASTINNSYNSLTKAFANAGFEFFQKKLSGRSQPSPRWKYATGVIDSRLGELAGQLYVRKYFDQSAKDRMNTLIDNLIKSYETHIKSLDWMSESTKSKALEKLHTIGRKIGFPDIWRSYDSLVILKDNYFQNRINTSRYEFYRAIHKVGKPVDKAEWDMTPSTVNAGYYPTKNQIVFPAGILQPPFFDARADDAVNYGGIGAVIGHELTHGFDDQGRQYDKDGNLTDWWAKEDADKFNEITKKIVAQYSMYVPVDTLHVNGELTLGENIADIGGMAIAYDAFKLTDQSKSDKKIDGLSPDQRFFHSFAQIWRIKMRDEFSRQLVLTDVHSPSEFRVAGPLSNFTPFYQAYGLTENNKMWKKQEDRIKIW